MIDSCPQRRGMSEVTAGLSSLSGRLRLWPCVILTACAAAKPFPIIAQTHGSLYPVCQPNSSHFSPCMLQVILQVHMVHVFHIPPYYQLFWSFSCLYVKQSSMPLFLQQPEEKWFSLLIPTLYISITDTQLHHFTTSLLSLPSSVSEGPSDSSCTGHNTICCLCVFAMCLSRRRGGSAQANLKKGKKTHQ